jgi:hypothetical protein
VFASFDGGSTRVQHHQFWVFGRIDKLDPNVVFGLFGYPIANVEPDGTHEIDIEFAKWGASQAPIGELHGLTPQRTRFKIGRHDR